MADNIDDKFWIMLPHEQARDLPQLMLSPAAVKEDKERRLRLLCDHSWDFGWPSINKVTKPHAPPVAMQFGHALHRVLHQMRHANPRLNPVRTSKQDVKDGFHRLFLRPEDSPRLSILLPSAAP